MFGRLVDSRVSELLQVKDWLWYKVPISSIISSLCWSLLDLWPFLIALTLIYHLRREIRRSSSIRNKDSFATEGVAEEKFSFLLKSYVEHHFLICSWYKVIKWVNAPLPSLLSSFTASCFLVCYHAHTLRHTHLLRALYASHHGELCCQRGTLHLRYCEYFCWKLQVFLSGSVFINR